MELFDSQPSRVTPSPHAPLAERVRPTALTDFVGQDHLLGEEKPLRVLVEGDRLPSMIFWGPPGSGKTTLARILSRQIHAEFYQLNAVASGVKEVREVIERAGANRKQRGLRTILFIDEIHRFNKAQQDALLHSVEDGVITLIGATTENPSFEVISPLLSRCRVYVLHPLTDDQLTSILGHALKTDPEMQRLKVRVEDASTLLLHSGGDARTMLNGLETAVYLTKPGADGSRAITARALQEAFQKKRAQYDDGGEQHYNIISAFIKSIRGSDPDAAVYWLARMLEGGEDPKFIARRMIILASEDIGNADPNALTLATSCFTAVDYVGMPEAQLILAQGATYLACCPKSNASTVAIGEAIGDVRSHPDEPVPLHLRNATTRLMSDLGYGKDYRYSHNFDQHVVEQQYLPDGMKAKIYYRPTDNGQEKVMKERLNSWWKNKQR